MAVHKHQGDRDVELLSLNARVGLGRDWIATGQLVGDRFGAGVRHAYHLSTDWRNPSGYSAFVELEQIGSGFRPNETGLEDEAYTRARGTVAWAEEYSEGSLLNALVLRGRLFRQTAAGGRPRERYAQAEGSLDVGRLDLWTYGRVGQLREEGLLWDGDSAGLDLSWASTRGALSLYNQVGERQGDPTWYASLAADANLHGRFALALTASRFDWGGRQERGSPAASACACSTSAWSSASTA